jgi:nucleoside 2-deoxyribosyltransferase
MKIYFAGPLFTPYVRQYISDHAKILRENGIDVFVPHEQPMLSITPDTIRQLLQQGLVSKADLDGKDPAVVIMDMVREGKLTREQAGLPPSSADAVFEKDYEGLSTANAVLAILDGTQVDDGTACELGIFFALKREDPTKKGFVGLMTDSRGINKKERSFGVNYFVLGVLEEYGKVYTTFEEALAQLKAWNEELSSGQ